jgi:hypothetical protein
MGAATWDLKNIDWMTSPKEEKTELLLGPGQTLI